MHKVFFYLLTLNKKRAVSCSVIRWIYRDLKFLWRIAFCVWVGYLIFLSMFERCIAFAREVYFYYIYIQRKKIKTHWTNSIKCNTISILKISNFYNRHKLINVNEKPEKNRKNRDYRLFFNIYYNNL